MQNVCMYVLSCKLKWRKRGKKLFTIVALLFNKNPEKREKTDDEKKRTTHFKINLLNYLNHRTEHNQRKKLIENGRQTIQVLEED